MGTMEIFDHTADVGLRIGGESRADLFTTAAEAMFDYIVANRAAVRPEVTQTVALSSDDPAELLATWLDEWLFRSETQHLLFSHFTAEVSADGLSVTGTASGEAINRDRHILDHEVKAVTRHGFILEPDGSGWRAEFILDI